MTYSIPTLPIEGLIESPKILKKAIAANKVIAELKGVAQTIPNQEIIINTLSIQESKDSSEVENIITTHDELFQYEEKDSGVSPAAKEVHRYQDALFYGVNVLEKQNITSDLLIKLMQILTDTDTGFRDEPGTILKNRRTGEVVYTPPQDRTEIAVKMKNLEHFINLPEMCDFDPLVKMAIIHHQFESIHPFFDGNGRTGRILNILYLIDQDILDIPVLYLSRYITQNKSEYYRLLQVVRDEGTWEDWILFLLEALETTARQAIVTVEAIKSLMTEYKNILQEKDPKLYSRELLELIFSHPYTKTEFLVEEFGLSRLTAAKHLKRLVAIGLLDLEKHKNTNYYINTNLLGLFTGL